MTHDAIRRYPPRDLKLRELVEILEEKSSHHFLQENFRWPETQQRRNPDWLSELCEACLYLSDRARRDIIQFLEQFVWRKIPGRLLTGQQTLNRLFVQYRHDLGLSKATVNRLLRGRSASNYAVRQMLYREGHDLRCHLPIIRSACSATWSRHLLGFARGEKIPDLFFYREALRQSKPPLLPEVLEYVICQKGLSLGGLTRKHRSGQAPNTIPPKEHLFLIGNFKHLARLVLLFDLVPCRMLQPLLPFLRPIHVDEDYLLLANLQCPNSGSSIIGTFSGWNWSKSVAVALPSVAIKSWFGNAPTNEDRRYLSICQRPHARIAAALRTITQQSP